MKILLDENLDYRLKFHLSALEVFMLAEMGWSGLKNGTLIERLIKSEFDFFLTADKNLWYQQNEIKLIFHKVSVIILKGSNFLEEHILHLKGIKEFIRKKTAGGFIEIGYAQ